MNRRLVALAAVLVGAAALTVPSSDAHAQGVMVSTDRGTGGLGQGTHVVQPGETLFGLADRFLGNPYLWPQLWAYNPQITNPHWIYPGDVLFLRPEARPNERTYPEDLGRFFPLGGFYSSGEFDVWGEIKYADTGRRLLQPLDTVYLEFENPDDIAIGQEFAINHVIDRVYNDDRELVAVKYLVTGMVRVTARHHETHLLSGEITQLWDTIERGDALFLSEPQLLRVVPRENEVDLDGIIFDRLNPVRHMHEQDYIYINLGHDDGVRVGNRFRIWDRADEGEQIRAATTRGLEYEDIQAEIPWQNVGEAMVIYTTDEYATAVITNAGLHELTVGLRVTMQAGE